MQLTFLALSLTVAVPMVSAYPITGNNVNCREGPSTGYEVVKTYHKGDDVKLTCQTSGEGVLGNSLWDKTSDGCYVADYYVKTGTSGMVTKDCGHGGGSGSSSLNGKISRREIISRAQYWVSRHVPYSMSATYPDPEGTRYRTDCSGFVTMALHATAPGYNTVRLPEIAKEISWKDLQPGDFVGTLGPAPVVLPVTSLCSTRGSTAPRRSTKRSSAVAHTAVSLISALLAGRSADSRRSPTGTSMWKDSL
ncbi:hypothetical protein QL093DRAFT_2090362 [Fusarium oxysporum]|nr:hypothetical protein QL093DRAFT_2090362 [Fusarium oxysporum]